MLVWFFIASGMPLAFPAPTSADHGEAHHYVLDWSNGVDDTVPAWPSINMSTCIIVADGAVGGSGYLEVPTSTLKQIGGLSCPLMPLVAFETVTVNLTVQTTTGGTSSCRERNLWVIYTQGSAPPFTSGGSYLAYNACHLAGENFNIGINVAHVPNATGFYLQGAGQFQKGGYLIHSVQLFDDGHEDPPICDPDDPLFDPEVITEEDCPDYDFDKPTGQCDFEAGENIQSFTDCLADFEWDCGTPDYEFWDVLAWTEFIGCNIVGQIAFMAYAIVHSLGFVASLLAWGFARLIEGIASAVALLGQLVGLIAGIVGDVLDGLFGVLEDVLAWLFIPTGFALGDFWDVADDKVPIGYAVQAVAFLESVDYEGAPVAVEADINGATVGVPIGWLSGLASPFRPVLAGLIWLLVGWTVWGRVRGAVGAHDS